MKRMFGDFDFLFVSDDVAAGLSDPAVLLFMTFAKASNNPNSHRAEVMLLENVRRCGHINLMEYFSRKGIFRPLRFATV